MIATRVKPPIDSRVRKDRVTHEVWLRSESAADTSDIGVIRFQEHIVGAPTVDGGNAGKRPVGHYGVGQLISGLYRNLPRITCR